MRCSGLHFLGSAAAGKSYSAGTRPATELIRLWGLMISRRKPGGNYRKVQMFCRRRSEKVKRRASWIRTSSRGTFASCWTQTVGISPGPWRIARGRQSKRRCSALTATRASLLGCLGLRRAAFTTRCENTVPEAHKRTSTPDLSRGNCARMTNAVARLCKKKSVDVMQSGRARVPADYSVCEIPRLGSTVSRVAATCRSRRSLGLPRTQTPAFVSDLMGLSAATTGTNSIFPNSRR